MITPNIIQKLDMEKFTQSVMRRIEQQYDTYNKMEVRVGIPDGLVNDEGELISQYAKGLEYGVFYNNQPARPFAKKSITDDIYRQNLLNVVRNKGIVDNIDQKYRALNTLMFIGKKGVDNIRASIMTQAFAPLSYNTLKEKKGKYMLIESGAMFDNFTYEVINRKG